MAKNRVGGVAVDQLKSIIARVEKLTEEKAAIAADISDVFAEAKGNGFDVKAIREIIKKRRLDASELEEQETVLDTYMRAIGMMPELDEADEAPQSDQPGIGEHDSLYETAVLIVKGDRSASISHLMRKMTIGHNRAACMIDAMEEQGIISAANYAGKREVLAPPPEETAA